MTMHHTACDPSRVDARQNRVAQRLALAIAQRSLKVHYQPEMDIRTGRLVSLEALCRWHDQELNQVAPDEFIAVAEARGLIQALGGEILRMVLQDMPPLLARWPGIRVAVNVSGIELAQVDFASRVMAAVLRADAAYAPHLELEVTESVFHYDLPTVHQNLVALKAHGLSVAIDDFGTGQSSLARLHTLPFDKIKMDKSFAQGLSNPMVQSIVGLMRDLAAQFGRALVTEGVETPQQIERLRAMNCTLVQGYGLCPPKPLVELLDTPGLDPA